MKIIEKVSIRNFRSIKKLDLDFDSSVSILSGVNSCGKTNILRAMNLFFNDEVGFGKKISVSDFFMNGEVPSSVISITIFFNSYESDRVKKQRKAPEKFSIKKTYTYRAGFFNQATQINGATEKQKPYCEDFLEKWIRFHYIPTDRKVFFKKIHNELSEFLGSSYGFTKLKDQFSDLKNNFGIIEKSLNTRDIAQLELSVELSKRLGITKVGYALPEVHNLLKVLDFVIEREHGEKGFVSTEGDGIKFINLLQILDIFDSRYSKESRTRPYASIWAIDEPENSLEQKNIELFKQEIYDKHSQNKQIFLTSHSPEFLLEPDVVGRNKFYGFENNNRETKLITGDDLTPRLPFTEFERQMLIEKMGVGMTREEKIHLKNQAEAYKNDLDRLSGIIEQSDKPIIIVEDSFDKIYKIAYLKIHGLSFTKETLDHVFDINCPFKVYRAEGASCLAGFLRAKNIDMYANKKVIGVFDFDTAGVGQFKCLKNNTYWGDDFQGDKTTGIFKKRKGHNCFYALLLPIPGSVSQFADYNFESNYIEIENLLPDEFLLNGNFATYQQLAGGAIFIKASEDKKSEVWKSMFNLDPNVFENFKPLFNKIEVIFNA